MGFFKEIFIKDTKTGKLVNITDLDAEHYESFLECTTKIKAAYIAELERRGDASTRLSNCNIPRVVGPSELLCIDCQEKPATHGIGATKTLCRECWNRFAG